MYIGVRIYQNFIPKIITFVVVQMFRFMKLDNCCSLLAGYT